MPFFKEGCVYLSRLRKFKKELRISQTDAEEQEKYDDVRTEKLKNDGFYVMRFWNSDVLNNLSIVLDIIYNALENKKAPLTRRAKNARRPLPQGER